MKKLKSIHVAPAKTGRGWVVKPTGKPVLSPEHPTMEQAIEVAERMARAQRTDIKIHGPDGKIRAGNSYGDDPSPPTEWV